MSSVADQLPSANDTYVANFGEKGSLALPPSKKVAIVTCMDARIDPAAALGLPEGSAHIIRNAGGRAADALRSLIISQQLLGTREVLVVHHTDCGMLTFTDAEIRDKLNHPDANHIAFLPFTDLERSVHEDVDYIKRSVLLVPRFKITGWIYDVKTGKVEQVV
ncbi:hypothetical protein BOTBODRAFT_165773 [Botryobasidium botryosum FD-172 SS1]|uniref:Carbonic anhydrase n=1 Tax=Botryobasidium botryosum (strain FD-172 SS1) TaxID=930990 RepID=A0A067M1D0_BOTB1|nr:hypothetical protein BOTBODRAFT_165773 [Botryobasidium botryosum FD-172 SS1]